MAWGCREASCQGVAAAAAAAAVAGHLEAAAAAAEAPFAAAESSAFQLHLLHPLVETDEDGVEGAWYHLAAESAVAAQEHQLLPIRSCHHPAVKEELAYCPG